MYHILRPLWRYRGKICYFGGKNVARMDVFLVKKVIFISKKRSLHVFRRHRFKSCENGGWLLCHLTKCRKWTFSTKSAKVEVTAGRTFKNTYTNLVGAPLIILEPCSSKPSFWSVFRRNATSIAAFSLHVEVIAGCTLKKCRRIWSVLRRDLSNYAENPTFDQCPDWKCYYCRNRWNELLWSQHMWRNVNFLCIKFTIC